MFMITVKYFMLLSHPSLEELLNFTNFTVIMFNVKENIMQDFGIMCTDVLCKI